MKAIDIIKELEEWLNSKNGVVVWHYSTMLYDGVSTSGDDFSFIREDFLRKKLNELKERINQ